MTRFLLAALTGLSVAACTTGGSAIDGGETIVPLPDFEADDAMGDNRVDPGAWCGANAMAYLVGQPIAEVDLETLHGNVRVIHPGMPITRDYRRERLNLDLDEAGVILRPWCG